MDKLLETLRTSVDNERRKAAAAQLRQVQETHPTEFLDYTLQCVASAAYPADLRFFAATTVLAFVEESWRTALDKAAQLAYVQRYASVALDGSVVAPPILARKVATIVAVMARRGVARAQPGQLPPLLDTVATTYTQTLAQRCLGRDGSLSPDGAAELPHLLMLIHVLLKETQARRVGDAFERLCQGMVAPLSGVFAALAPCSPLDQFEATLFLYKAALRVFGMGVFEPTFYRFLLDATWRLAAGLDPNEEGDMHAKRARLVDYGVKIQERAVASFPTRLRDLGEAFFLPRDVLSVTTAVRDSNVDGIISSERSLFALVGAVVAAGAEGAASASTFSRSMATDARALLPEKTVCRAMRLLTFFHSCGEGDTFLSDCAGALSRSSLLPPLVRDIVTGYLADDCGPDAAREWATEPEKVAADLDVDFDDDAPASCAEQLFLALTGSTTGAAAALPVAWQVVNELLSSSPSADGATDEGSGGGNAGERHVRAVTAALHAVGIGYYTMAAGAAPGDFLQFLRAQLLPMLAAACTSAASGADTMDAAGNTAAPSLPVLRRVVWLMGMWCESVTEPAARMEVHVAFGAVLESFPDSVVLLLTTLRAVENFVTDQAFTPEELPEQTARTVLAAAQRVLTHLRAPTTVRQVACLVSSLVRKGVVPASGVYLLNVFAPPAIAFIARCERDAVGDRTGSEATTDGDYNGDGDSEGVLNVSVLPLLIETLTSITDVCATSGQAGGDPLGGAAAWQLYAPVVVACTTPGRAVTPWAEDAAWELLVSMARGSTCVEGFSNIHQQREQVVVMYAVAAEAFRWCQANSVRDFETLHLAVRAAATLMLLLEEGAVALGAAAPGAVTAVAPVTHDDAARYLRIMTETAIDELTSSCFALLLAIGCTRAATPDLTGFIVEHCITVLTGSGDVQAESFAVPLAVLLALTVAADTSRGLLHTFLAAAAALGSSLLENLVLVLDVCPNPVATRAIGGLLAQFQAAAAATNAVPPNVARMVQHAVESAAAAAGAATTGAAPAAVLPVGDHGEGEERPQEELLLELLGDEDATLAMPHVRRVLQLYGPLLQL